MSEALSNFFVNRMPLSLWGALLIILGFTAFTLATALAGRWDEREFVASFRRKDWKLILVSNLADRTRYSQAVREAIVENYEKGETIDGKAFYWPKQSGGGARASLPRP
jgi:hypothetical protein